MIQQGTVAPVTAEKPEALSHYNPNEWRPQMATSKPITFDDISGSGGLVGNLRLAAMISQEINLLLKDTSNLRNTPLLSYQGSINGTGSDTVRVRLAGLDGFDSMAAATSVPPGTVTTTPKTQPTENVAGARECRNSAAQGID